MPVICGERYGYGQNRTAETGFKPFEPMLDLVLTRQDFAIEAFIEAQRERQSIAIIAVAATSVGSITKIPRAQFVKAAAPAPPY
jgi:hypothetical protein